MFSSLFGVKYLITARSLLAAMPRRSVLAGSVGSVPAMYSCQVFNWSPSPSFVSAWSKEIPPFVSPAYCAIHHRGVWPGARSGENVVTTW